MLQNWAADVKRYAPNPDAVAINAIIKHLESKLIVIPKNLQRHPRGPGMFLDITQSLAKYVK